MHLCLFHLQLSCGGKKRVSQVFSYISCGTLRWVRIILVKVDHSLTEIIRTYITIYVGSSDPQTPRRALTLAM